MYIHTKIHTYIIYIHSYIHTYIHLVLRISLIFYVKQRKISLPDLMMSCFHNNNRPKSEESDSVGKILSLFILLTTEKRQVGLNYLSDL